MIFISESRYEDEVVRKVTLDTVSNNENVAVSTTFANGYAVNIVRNNNTICIDVLKGSMYYNTHLVFKYDEGEFEYFINAVSTAETEFEVGFACGKLTPKYLQK